MGSKQSKPEDKETLQNMENVRLLKQLLLKKPLSPELTEIVLKYAQEEKVKVNLSPETRMEVDREHLDIEFELRKEAGKLIPIIKDLITVIETSSRNHRIVRLTGTSVEIVGGGVAVAGLIMTIASGGTLSPVGVSLMISGGLVGTFGGVTHGGSAVAETDLQRKLTTSFQETFETFLSKFYNYQILHLIKKDIPKVGKYDVLRKTKEAVVGLKNAGTLLGKGAVIAIGANLAGSSGKVASTVCKQASKVAAEVTSKVCLGFNIAFVGLDIGRLVLQVHGFFEGERTAAGEKTEVTQKLTRTVLWLEKIASGHLRMELDLNPPKQNSK